MSQSALSFLNSNRASFQKRNLLLFFKQVYGLGVFRTRHLCIFFGFNKDFHGKLGTVDYSKTIVVPLLVSRYKILLMFVLKRRRSLIFSLHKSLKTYKSVRHFYGLPSRGQRTHSNASTASKKKFY